MDSSFSHLTLEERRKIERWRQVKVSPTIFACRSLRMTNLFGVSCFFPPQSDPQQQLLRD